MKFIKVCRMSTDEEFLLNVMHIESVRVSEQDEGIYLLIFQTTTGNSYWSRDSFRSASEAERWFTSELTEGPPEVPVRIVPPEPGPSPEFRIGMDPKRGRER